MINSQETAIKELDNQNSILLQNTISGQKLALEICKDNYSDAVSSSFQKWMSSTKRDQILKREHQLKANMEVIVNLRLKIKELDMENNGRVLKC